MIRVLLSRSCLEMIVGQGLAVGLLAVVPALSETGSAEASDQGRPAVTIRRPSLPQPIPPQVPPPVSVIPGYPVPFDEASIVDGRTRFLTSGPAQARCPDQDVVFVAGVANPRRPTILGDGAFMCRGDAVAEGYLAP